MMRSICKHSAVRQAVTAANDVSKHLERRISHGIIHRVDRFSKELDRRQDIAGNADLHTCADQIGNDNPLFDLRRVRIR